MDLSFPSIIDFQLFSTVNRNYALYNFNLLEFESSDHFLFIYFFVFLLFLWAAPAAYGGSQARGRIGAVATGLRQSHSNAGSEPRLQPTPQLTATPDG